MDQATAKNWLHNLETLGIVFLLRPYSNKVPKRTVSTLFELIGKSPLERETGAVLCMANRLEAFDQDNLIVPISLI